MTTNPDHAKLVADRAGRRTGLALLMLGALLPVLCSSGTATASVTVSRESGIASARPIQAAGALEVAGWSKKGNSNSAFKPDPIYGGGRGRDPYGTALETDPYRAGGNPNNIKFAPPNAGLHGNAGGRPKKSGKAEAEQAPPDRRRMNPDDQSADNRANRAAAKASEEERE